MTTIDMRPVTETRSKANTVCIYLTGAHKSSRTSPTGRTAIAQMSDTREKHITPLIVRITPLLTMEHRHLDTREFPVTRHHTEGRALVMELTPTGMIPVILMVGLHPLRTELMGIANNIPLSSCNILHLH